MRKRKINPSLEVAAGLRDVNLGLGGNTVSEVHKVAAVIPHKIVQGSQPVGDNPTKLAW